MGSLLTEFIIGEAIGRLDSAFCVLKRRSYFLSLLSCKEYKLKMYESLFSKATNNVSLVEWCALRSVKLHTLHWTTELKDVDYELMVKFASVTMPHIEVLIVTSRSLDSIVNNQSLRLNNLKTLHWNIASATENRALFAILAHAHFLEEFYLPSDNNFGKRIDTESICCFHVRRLYIGGNWHEDRFNWLNGVFPNAAEISWFVDWFPKASEELICSFTHLEKVFYVPDVGDSFLCGLADACPLLTSFVIFNGEEVTDNGIEYLCSKCSRLESIKLSDNLNITSNSLHSISVNLRHTLRELLLEGCSSIESFAPLQHCSKLQRIDFSHSPDSHTGHLIGLFTTCTTLQAVSIDFRVVGDEVLFALAKHCPQLQELSLLRSTGYSQAGLEELADHARSLKKLYLDEICAELRAKFETNGCLLIEAISPK